MYVQILHAALSSSALAPLLAPVLPLWLTLVSCLLAAMLIGALWAAVPALLKACYGINEIVTTLMMSFLGVNLANVLIKLAFRDPGTSVPQTLTLAPGERLPKMLGTSVHLGVALALAVTLLIHFLMTRTALGLRLRIIGCSPRAAVHAGLAVRRLTVVAFGLSAALAGLAGAVEILGVWGTMRTDWNPAYGLLVIPLVFLARFNGITVIAFVFLFAVIAIGGETAARRTDLPNDFVLLLVGLLLIFMALMEWLSQRLRARKAVGL